MNKSLLIIVVAFIAINTNAQFKDRKINIGQQEGGKLLKRELIELTSLSNLVTLMRGIKYNCLIGLIPVVG